MLGFPSGTALFASHSVYCMAAETDVNEHLTFSLCDHLIGKYSQNQGTALCLTYVTGDSVRQCHVYKIKILALQQFGNGLEITAGGVLMGC